MDSTSFLAIKNLLASFKEKNQKMNIELFHRKGEENTLQQLRNILSELYYEDATVKAKTSSVSNEYISAGIYADLDETLLVEPKGLAFPLEYHPAQKEIQFIRRIEELVTQRALQARTPYTALHTTKIERSCF
jgi:hypothetical protein